MRNFAGLVATAGNQVRTSHVVSCASLRALRVASVFATDRSWFRDLGKMIQKDSGNLPNLGFVLEVLRFLELLGFNPLLEMTCPSTSSAMFNILNLQLLAKAARGFLQEAKSCEPSGWQPVHTCAPVHCVEHCHLMRSQVRRRQLPIVREKEVIATKPQTQFVEALLILGADSYRKMRLPNCKATSIVAALRRDATQSQWHTVSSHRTPHPFALGTWRGSWLRIPICPGPRQLRFTLRLNRLTHFHCGQCRLS